jgi:DNA-binding MarR family transcriptional regulator
VEKEGTPSTRLAQQLGMKNSSLTRVLKKMEVNGCIIREVDQNDKRIIRIFLTPKGVEKRKIAKKKVLEFNERLIEKTNEKDLESFFKVFDIIKEQVAKEIEEATNKVTINQ